MIKSMTGFGAAEGEVGEVIVEKTGRGRCFCLGPRYKRLSRVS